MEIHYVGYSPNAIISNNSSVNEVISSTYTDANIPVQKKWLQILALSVVNGPLYEYHLAIRQLATLQELPTYVKGTDKWYEAFHPHSLLLLILPFAI